MIAQDMDAEFSAFLEPKTTNVARELRASILVIILLTSGVVELTATPAHAEAGASMIVADPATGRTAFAMPDPNMGEPDRAKEFRETLEETKWSSTQWASTKPGPRGITPPVEPTAGTTNAAPSSLFAFSDTQISYRFQGPAADPNVSVVRPTGGPLGRVDGRENPKNVINLFHTDSWAYGSNLISLDILQSGSQDPAGNQFRTFTNAVGATELYLIYRGVLSGNKIFNTTSFSVPGVIKDIGLAFGADIGTKNTRFDAEKRAGTFGLNFAIDVPVGFLNLKVQAYKEFGRAGTAGIAGILGTPAVVGFDFSHFRSVEYKMTPEFEIAYTFPLTFTGLPLAIAGFNNIIMPKGKYGAINQNQTQVEFLSRTNIVLDVGKLIYNEENRFDAFIGFQYWLNKFGYDPVRTVNTEEKAFIAGVAFHLN